jgi:hypothetical protein
MPTLSSALCSKTSNCFLKNNPYIQVFKSNNLGTHMKGRLLLKLRVEPILFTHCAM